MHTHIFHKISEYFNNHTVTYGVWKAFELWCGMYVRTGFHCDNSRIPSTTMYAFMLDCGCSFTSSKTSMISIDENTDVLVASMCDFILINECLRETIIIQTKYMNIAYGIRYTRYTRCSRCMYELNFILNACDIIIMRFRPISLNGFCVFFVFALLHIHIILR